MNREADVIELLTQLASLLEEHGETAWAARVEHCIHEYTFSTSAGRSAVSRMYGGMGSLSDLVLHKNGAPLNDENDHFDALRSEIFETYQR
ncbi:MAG: hypothetical protein GC159_16685 [Phycisphaera sp.]|nr:hypothetical protein [Phycisphaera sp.]